MTTNNSFDNFCQAAMDFLAGERVPFLIVGGLAVAALGEPRFTADLDVVPTPEDLLLFKIISGREKDVLDAVGIARRHRESMDWQYVEAGVDEVCDLAEQTGPRELLAHVRPQAN